MPIFAVSIVFIETFLFFFPLSEAFYAGAGSNREILFLSFTGGHEFLNVKRILVHACAFARTSKIRINILRKKLARKFNTTFWCFPVTHDKIKIRTALGLVHTARKKF